jgi:hypothetical protein
MRINVYGEELGPDPRIEIIEKKTGDGTFTGLRIYLELPVTVLVCNACGALEPTTTIKRLMSDHTAPVPIASLEQCRDTPDGVHRFRPRQLSGPFQHGPGDDDSSAVTFWGKRDLRDVLKVALTKLDEHYKTTRLLSLDLPEEDRQMVLLALAVLSLESPGFDDALNRIALRIDNHYVRRVDDSERAVTYDEFRDARRKPIGHGG